MSETPTGYRESPAPTEENLIDGTPGNDVADGGEKDVTLTTDDDAQRDDSQARPGNASD
jgi:hypothetical protein